MKKYLLLAGVGFCCLSGTAWAELNCNEPPECDALGYTLTEDDCSNRTVLRCPFDYTQVFCVQSCAQIGYTENSCALGQQATLCPLDQLWVKCSGKSNVQKCIDEGYTIAGGQGGIGIACVSGQNVLDCPYDTEGVRYIMCSPKTSAQVCQEKGYTKLTGSCPEGQSRIDCPSNAEYFKCGYVIVSGGNVYIATEKPGNGGSGGTGGGASSGGDGSLVFDNAGYTYETVGYTDKDFTRPN